MRTLLKTLPVVGPVFTEIAKMRLKYHRWKMAPERNLRRILGEEKEVFVVQIGSNDGSSGDPIFKLLRQNPSWSALLVEPVPFLFERLRRNYGGRKNLRFENVAISEEVGISKFYSVDTVAARQRLPDLPDWVDQLGSFDREHVSRHFGSALEQFISSTDLPTLPLSALLERNKVTAIDLFHIDTEGYDWIILRQLDLKKFHPKVILFEHTHLSEADKSAARSFLEPKYRITDLGVDYLCELEKILRR